MKKHKKIGIMGGAFDPIHYGHLMIAENAAEQYELDEVFFMPNGQSPLKNKRHITDAFHRCEMIRLAIADNPRFHLSTLEIETQGTSYTYLTLESLKKQYPEDQLFFIMGGDSLKDFDSWRYPERIVKVACVLAAVRDNVDGSIFQNKIAYLRERYGEETVFSLKTPNYEVSSNGIRTRTGQKQTIRYMVPEPVREYIQKHDLYKDRT